MNGKWAYIQWLTEMLAYNWFVVGIKMKLSVAMIVSVRRPPGTLQIDLNSWAIV